MRFFKNVKTLYYSRSAQQMWQILMIIMVVILILFVIVFYSGLGQRMNDLFGQLGGGF